MTPTLDAALLYLVQREGVTTTSSRAGTDLCNHQYRLRLEDVYLELNAFPDLESNPGPFDLEPTALIVIPPCFGPYLLFETKSLTRREID